jgi:hypothetical protein
MPWVRGWRRGARWVRRTLGGRGWGARGMDGGFGAGLGFVVVIVGGGGGGARVVALSSTSSWASMSDSGMVWLLRSAM